MTSLLEHREQATHQAQKSSKRQQRPRPGSAPWAMAAAIFLAICGTSIGMVGVLRGSNWIFPIALTVGTVLAAIALSRTLRLPSALAPAFGAVALVLVLDLLFFADTAFLGLIPSQASLEQLGPLFQQTSDSVVREVAPIAVNPGVLFVLCLSIGLITILTDLLAVGLLMPATSGLPLVAIALVPAMIKADSLGVLGFVLGVAGYLLILVSSRRFQSDSAGRSSTSQWLRVGSVGAGALVLALVLSIITPGFTSGTFPQGSRFNPFGQVAGLSPFLALGNDLRNPDGAGQVIYATSADHAPYLQTVTIDNFDSDNWEPTDRGNAIQLDGEISDAYAAQGVINTQVRTQLSTANFSNSWLPVPYAPQQVTGLIGRWSLDPKTLSIKAIDQNTLGQSYQVQSLEPVLTPEILRSAVGRPRTGFDPIFMTLPQNTPTIVRERAHELTDRSPTPYDKAMAIQQYLRGENFSYSLQAPVSGGYDGSSMDALAKFLEVKSGYCVHFSAAMALMARVAGIPSRIAVGFAPGTSTGQTVTVGDQKWKQYTVDARLAHAWPELYFEGLGWVPFEPTPSRGQVPDYAIPPSGPISNDQPQDEVPKPTSSRNPSEQPSTPEPQAVESGNSSSGFNPWWIALPLGLLAVLAVPALSRASLRRRRAATDSATSAWGELRDSAVDYGVDYRPSDTPRRFANRLKDSGQAGSSEITTLVQDFERSSYGPPGDSGSSLSAAARTELEHTRTSLRLLAPLGRRWRAALLPASTLRRWSSGVTKALNRLRGSRGH
ncbi:transglutaminase-like putative cysteine protease [Psychromicrobium silvestre]|uniref:Transglutaminase-like putative cysteine protease n=1 Tax=Psychromicrobium silvestre TaxID=1645614 RepID=A0A7Y9S9T0_9MICC|nr:DUF3488 and transglutaminase-like domain-containing protein [Psychromicrobium silvestre]NYE96562.1 transglutaminase-like putative cysteine protease [Psychromicrobium silvestre]